ncbi:hypothetical protein OGAPHI_004464 [Ogataea philodendri]|uniref:Stress response RCI peptide n=1 Tax=Ogataea philodendri TaxID=1378263 RepID=A0A9P8T5N8_9ASCO|nr:uncharacterized protein OGAPHI_004464 [Ogataea philodendri]KAH3666275.1 hypothetical protein OGAPHI_004464 [Ogataea philodendri]
MSRDPPPNSFRILGFVIDPADVLLYCLAFIFPPLPVFFRKGFFSYELLIAMLLTILAHFPGLLYSVYIIYDTSLITGSDRGVETRLRAYGQGNGEYEPLNDDPEAQPREVLSPVPQRLGSQFHYQDSAPDAEPTEATAVGSSANPPSYDDAIKNSTSPPPLVGDHKVQND